MAPHTVEQIVERVGRAEWLDKVAQPLSQKVSEAIPKGALKDTLSGTWLGHPLHPMLTDLPSAAGPAPSCSTWSAAAAAGRRRTSWSPSGILTALPTAASGLADWSDTSARSGAWAWPTRAATPSPSPSTACPGSRLRGRRAKGVVLSFLGAAAATAGAYLGGHLAWRKGVNVSRHAWQESKEDWTDVAAEEELAGDGPCREGRRRPGPDRAPGRQAVRHQRRLRPPRRPAARG